MPSFGGATSSPYMPLRTVQVCPDVAVDTHFWIVAKGCAREPSLVSAPFEALT
jgi:hypothetical protein